MVEDGTTVLKKETERNDLMYSRFIRSDEEWLI